MTGEFLGEFVLAAVVSFLLCLIGVPVLLGVGRLLGLYTTVQERSCRVYVLFGKVLGILNEPGLHFLLGEIGPAALIVNLFGTCYTLDLRLDQEYRRSEPANQVSVITSSAERTASIELGKAAAIRPNLLGQALSEIAREPAVADAVFNILETQRLVNSNARVTYFAAGAESRLLTGLLAARGSAAPVKAAG